MTKKILIVDDEPNIIISLEFLMKKEGFSVAVAGDGEEALAKVESFSPDLRGGGIYFLVRFVGVSI